MAARPSVSPASRAWSRDLALDSTGHLLAGAGGVTGELASPGEAVIRVWNLNTREVDVLDAGDGQPSPGVEFLPDGRLLAAGPGACACGISARRPRPD